MMKAKNKAEYVEKLTRKLSAAPAPVSRTPETWYTASTGNHQGLVISEQTGADICVTYDKKDAPLIATAPKMLRAIHALLDCPDMNWDEMEPVSIAAIKEARAVIAETEGGAA
jgi:hypothetical protein